MIGLALSRFPYALLMLGFTNIVCMPLIKILGVFNTAVSSALLTVAFLSAIVIYNMLQGMTCREVLENKFTAENSGGGCLLGMLFIVAGIVIMGTATDTPRDGEAVKRDSKQMTKYEQVFFGSTFALLGAGIATMTSGVASRS